MGTIPLILAFVGSIRPAGQPFHVALATPHPGQLRDRHDAAMVAAGLSLPVEACPGSDISASRRGTPCSPALGTALLAGEGFDRSVSSVRFRLGLAAAILFGGCATVGAAFWTMRPGVNLHASIGGVADGFLWAALAWSAALAILAAWRAGRLGSSAVLLAAAAELGILYYAGTTQWGWSIAIPGAEPGPRRAGTQAERRADRRRAR